MIVVVTNNKESVIYNGEIFRHNDTFEADDIIAQSLIERGYVKEVTYQEPAEEGEVQEESIEADSLQDLTYQELKRLAAQKGLDASGKKDELIARISAAEAGGESEEAEEEPASDLPNTSMPE